MILIGVVVCGIVGGISGIIIRNKYGDHKKANQIVDISMFGICTVLFVAWCLLFS